MFNNLCDLNFLNHLNNLGKTIFFFNLWHYTYASFFICVLLVYIRNIQVYTFLLIYIYYILEINTGFGDLKKYILILDYTNIFRISLLLQMVSSLAFSYTIIIVFKLYRAFIFWILDHNLYIDTSRNANYVYRKCL